MANADASRGKILPFTYNSDESAQLGDFVLWDGKPAKVVLIIEPGTQGARDYSAPNGGVMVDVTWPTGTSWVLEVPDAAGMEIQFVHRANPSA